MNIFSIFQKREVTAPAATENKPQGGVTIRANKVYASQTNACLVSAFQRGLELRAKTFSRAKLCVERKVGDVWAPEVSNITASRDYRHLNYLFQVKPNDFMSAQQMWYLVQMYRMMYGCGAVYMPGGWRVAHSAFPVRVTGWNLMDNTYTITSEHLQNTYTATSEELFLCRGIYRQGRPLGESLVNLAQTELGLYLTAEQFNVDTLAKGGTQKMFVSEESSADPMFGVGSLDDSEVKSAVDDIREQVANNDDVIFMQGDLKTETRSQSFQDLQISEARREANESLARVCGIYGALIGLTVNSVYKSMDEAWHAFMELTMVPDWEEIEQELNAKLFGEPLHDQLRVRFHYENICIDSDHLKAQTAAARRSAGITTANEERAYLGLPGVEGGDKLQEPTNNGTHKAPSDSPKGEGEEPK